MSDTRPEPVRLTEDEWRRKEALEGCATYGHDYMHVVQGATTLVRIYCERCGASWAVTPT